MSVKIRDIRVICTAPEGIKSCGRKDRDKSAGAVWTWLRNLCLPPSDGKASD